LASPMMLVSLCCCFFLLSGSVSSFCNDLSTRTQRALPRSLSSRLEDEDMTDSDTGSISRRMILSSVLVASVVSVLGDDECSRASAYEKTFPDELIPATDRVIRQPKVDKKRLAPLAGGTMNRPLGAVLWGGALWFLTGSRSNPLVTPIANIFFDEKKEEWLKDRNEGLFGDLPLPLFSLLAVVFSLIGLGTDALVTLLTEGDRNISLQLAVVSLIGGGTLEIGRIASGEKKLTRTESDRDAMLEKEFQVFAESRLMSGGGSLHRNEVVKAFRRYYGKYRQGDNPNYPLTDLEIEQLLRSWSRPRGLQMSAAGFYSGLQINTDADAFVAR
jgi:hypothetical protein